MFRAYRICRDGHVVGYDEGEDAPPCHVCGFPTFETCPHDGCDAPIPGMNVRATAHQSPEAPRGACPNCSKTYQWNATGAGAGGAPPTTSSSSLTADEQELAILRRFVEHFDDVVNRLGESPPKCDLELDMRDVLRDTLGVSGVTLDSRATRWLNRLADRRATKPLLRCSDKRVNQTAHGFHARAYSNGGEDRAWWRLQELEDLVRNDERRAPRQEEVPMQSRADALRHRARIGILTALPKEYAAVSLMLNDSVEWSAGGAGANRRFLLGCIPGIHGGAHVVAVALLSDMGNNSAAISTTNLLHHIPNVRHVIMCGIAGGVPRPDEPEHDVRLGDIVVSDRKGVVQYDLVKEQEGGKIDHRHPPRPPGAELLEAIRHLQAQEELQRRPWEVHLQEGSGLKNGVRPPDDHNAKGELITYPLHPGRAAGRPRVFYSPVAAANRLLKNAAHRDRLSDEFGVKAIEMEGSGVADATWESDRAGYLVVRGICDYCDEAKGDTWQGAAAVAAAAYTRALIESMHVDDAVLRVEQKGVASPAATGTNRADGGRGPTRRGTSTTAAAGTEKPPRISVDVVMCVRPNLRDVEQFVRFSLANPHSTPIELPILHWRFTDVMGTSNSVLGWTDGLPGRPEMQPSTSLDETQWNCAMAPRGELAPGERRDAGLHLLRTNLIRLSGQRYTYSDPFLPSAEDQDTRLVLIVPHPADLTPDHAPTHVCTRSVVWEFNGLGSQMRPFASWAGVEGCSRDLESADDELARLLVSAAAARLGFAPPEYYSMTDLPPDTDAAVAYARKRRDSLAARVAS